MRKKSTYGLRPQQLARLFSISVGQGPMSQDKGARFTEEGEPRPSRPMGPEEEFGFSAPPPEIDGYKILGKLGEAGQGQVWRAVQLGTHREVALKVPHVGLASSRKALARFEREVEVAARLRHPNIARVHDSGVHQGLYFYTMDLIEGTNLDRYVEQARLTHREILELMRTICQAVQHAHQNGVIHRDLKPSNIVVMEDGRHFIVDFGLAKSLLTDDLAIIVSVDGEAAGTPAYMSPEQAAGRLDELDTRTDVYSLGVMLFALLTGEFPHDLSGSRQVVLRRIAEEEVRRPRRLNPRLDKDLEALLLKALDSIPDRRYSSAGELAQDIDNYLKGTPLVAGPPAVAYRLKKFVRRNVALSSAVVAAVVSLVLGLIATTAMYVQAEHARAEAQAVSDFLRKDVLWSLDLWRTGGRDVTARSILDAVSEKLEGKFTDRPLVEASIRRELGATYTFLGLYEAAERQFKRTLEIHQAHLGAGHQATLISMWDVGWVYWWESRYREAEPLLTEALEGMESMLDEDNEDRLYCMAILGWLYSTRGRFNEAEQLFRNGLSTLHRVLGEENVYSPTFIQGLAWAHCLQGRYDQAEGMFNRGLELSRRVRGEQDMQTLLLMSSLGELYRLQGRYTEAEPLLHEALDGERRVLGEQHSQTLETMGRLGWLCCAQGRYEEAESYLDQAIENSLQILGEEHFITADCLHARGTLYLSQGRYDEAEPLLTRAWKITNQILGEENWATLRVTNTRAKLCTVQSRSEEAQRLFEKALESRKEKLDDGHPAALDTANDFGVLRREQQRYEEAASLLRRALDGRQRKLGPDHPACFESKHELALLYIAMEEYEKAEPLLLDAYDGRETKLGPGHPHTVDSLRQLVRLYESWPKPDEAATWRARLPQNSDAAE
ncbi:MAG: serine/threonine protein kinase [Sedimentisphaerales bacterium]|nr:serine/threonine protein kinase [Sedimentisphaerales bacterium]